MIHYHGTPITPRRVLQTLRGKHFCVSFAAPQDVAECHLIGQSVMLDNGAYSLWRTGRVVDWREYCSWAQEWLRFPTTWAIIPDVIDGTERENDDLIRFWQWNVGVTHQAAPVWHLHESLERLARLTTEFPRVCFGSSGLYAQVGDARWHGRMIEAFNFLCPPEHPYPPSWIHMLRGMSLSGSLYPFASVDSTDVARNHNRNGEARGMADRWDGLQCPGSWDAQPVQELLPLLGNGAACA